MRRWLSVCVLMGWFSIAAAAPEKAGVRLFYRMVGGQSNGPFVLKTRTVAAPDGSARTASTGMADAGFTEYPFCSGYWSFSFRPQWGMFPRFAGHVPIDAGRVNTCDLVLDWVYEPDGCVWGPACRQFGQTFAAMGREMVSMTVLVASPLDTFHVAVHRHGPGGEEIAPRKRFVSGHSMEWGYVQWQPGEAILEPGERYYVRMWSDTDRPWNVYFHGAGDCYPAGHAYLEDRPRPESDLAVWIVNEPEDESRAIISDADADGWVRQVRGFEFIARTPNVRMITADVRPADCFCANVVACVWESPARRKLLCGPKYNASCARPDAAYEASFLYAPGELAVRPGDTYYVELFTVAFEEGQPPIIPEDRSGLMKRDLCPVVFGETSDTSAAVIFNVDAVCGDAHTMRVSWQLSGNAGVTLEMKDESGAIRRHTARPAENTMEVTGLRPGCDCDFRLLAFDGDLDVASAGPAWQTPWYRVRTPGGEPAKVLWPETPEFFVPLAPRADPRVTGDTFPDGSRVALADGDFENGLGQWKAGGTSAAAVCGATDGICPASGKRMYGWSLKAAADRQQVFAENDIRQIVPTEKGKWYALVAHGFTEVVNGPRGDVRIRLAADPKGGNDLKGANSSQWYWTDGRWMRLTHRFRAEADQATIAVGFFRWRDLDRASAFVDDVCLYELGEHP